MELELDHIFVCVQPNAPEGIALSNFGLKEGRRRVHKGQGTENSCFFFQNAYLELLWLRDINEIQSSVVQPTGLWQRCCWRETAACPFGISFRLTNNTLADIPFQTWNYYAPFLPEGLFLPIAVNSKFQHEPLIFLSPVSILPSAIADNKRPFLEHNCGFRDITAVKITLPVEKLSPELSQFEFVSLVEFIKGEKYHMQIEFDCGANSQIYNFAPDLPISFLW
jgi:Glyoxalase-like domain